jgi:hypothetical protein
MSIRHPHLARLLAVIRRPKEGTTHLVYEDTGTPLVSSPLMAPRLNSGVAACGISANGRVAAAQALLRQVGPLLAGLIHQQVGSGPGLWHA